MAAMDSRQEDLGQHRLEVMGSKWLVMGHCRPVLTDSKELDTGWATVLVHTVLPPLLGQVSVLQLHSMGPQRTVP